LVLGGGGAVFGDREGVAGQIDGSLACPLLAFPVAGEGDIATGLLGVTERFCVLPFAAVDRQCLVISFLSGGARGGTRFRKEPLPVEGRSTHWRCG
jgi:hypothetical protein